MNTKVAIVTGASSGIGLAIARSLLEREYRVVAVSRTISGSDQLLPSDHLVLVDGDVGNPDTAERAVSTAKSRYGRLDLLVNNAGIFIPKPFTEYTSEDYEKLVDTNLYGFFKTTQQALPSLIESGQGHVINISSSLTVQPVFNVPSALPILIKGGLEAVTRSLAIEYATQRVRVNTVSPGIVDTPMHRPESLGFLKTLSPSDRLGTPEEIAEAIAFLDASPYINGEVLRVDGGAHAGKWS